MLSVLKAALRQYPVSGRRRVARQGEVLLIDLMGVTADAHIRPIAVVSMIPIRYV